jgi:spermidine/putrescine transport system permease protein
MIDGHSSQPRTTEPGAVKNNLIIQSGHLTTTRAATAKSLLLASGALLWLLAFLVLPGLIVAALAFASRGDYGQVQWTFGWDNFVRLAGWGLFGWSADYLIIVGRSLLLAGSCTLFALLLALPLAFFIASQPPRWRYLLLALVTIPFCTNLVIRTYGWILLCSNQMPPARFAAWLGWIDDGTGLAPSAFAVTIGMVNAILPFAVLPLYPSIERLDWSLVEAARDNYASRWRTFRHAILPQITPGLISACILTFIPSIGMFVVSDLLGGAKYMLLGNLIQQQFGASRDWPFGAAICVVLMIMTLIGLWMMGRRGRESL